MKKGTKMSLESRKRLSIAQKKRFQNSAVWNKGTIGLVKPNSGSFQKGQVPWNKGKTRIEDERISQPWIGKKVLPHMRKALIEASKKRKGPLNPKWKGDGVGYRALHSWIGRILGKAKNCSYDGDHKSSRYHWANVSGKYLRDTGDWTSLCPKCHYEYDYLLGRRGNY